MIQFNKIYLSVLQNNVIIENELKSLENVQNTFSNNLTNITNQQQNVYEPTLQHSRTSANHQIMSHNSQIQTINHPIEVTVPVEASNKKQKHCVCMIGECLNCTCKKDGKKCTKLCHRGQNNKKCKNL